MTRHLLLGATAALALAFLPFGSPLQGANGSGNATLVATIDPSVANQPVGIDHARARGEAYVTDVDTGQVRVFDLDFNFLRVVTLGSPAFLGGGGVAADPASGNLFVSSLRRAANRGVLRFDPAGNYLTEFAVGSQGSVDLTVDPVTSTLFTTIWASPWKVEQYTFDGALVSSFNVPSVVHPRGIAFDAESRTLLVSDINNRVAEVALDGSFVGEFLPASAVPIVLTMAMDYDCVTGNLYVTGNNGSGPPNKEIFVYNDPNRPRCPAPVQIDIKPGSNRNSVNVKGKGGKVSVAILSSTEFDATQVDPSSVAFGPNEVAVAHPNGKIKDVNRDGFLDIVLRFPLGSSGIACGDTTASLTGQTYAGDQFQGQDAVRPVPCRARDDRSSDDDSSDGVSRDDRSRDHKGKSDKSRDHGSNDKTSKSKKRK